MDLNADLLLAHKGRPIINLDRKDQCESLRNMCNFFLGTLNLGVSCALIYFVMTNIDESQATINTLIQDTFLENATETREILRKIPRIVEIVCNDIHC